MAALPSDKNVPQTEFEVPSINCKENRPLKNCVAEQGDQNGLVISILPLRLLVKRKKNIEPSQSRTRRRGRGNATAIAKGPSAAKPARPAAVGRGRGVRLIYLDPEPACEALPQTVGLGAAQPAFNRVEGIADKEIAMEGGSGDKIVAEEDASTTLVPERDDGLMHTTVELQTMSLLSIAAQVSAKAES
ncbi:hypothetical protein PHJA_000645400 [Phtheirospermum japonicum]|uniref:Uncharacterized protein n=1 Tax=Phtheirospermum japonicum TaxID=374723 RepID=A0A830BDI8_9LAMI|nr:hypothetical protein PHJA_000645400 [Phtheirospermum japonicum]